jgi:hypothetical protein
MMDEHHLIMLSNDDVCIVLVEKIHQSQTVILSGYIDFLKQ